MLEIMLDFKFHLLCLGLGRREKVIPQGKALLDGTGWEIMDLLKVYDQIAIILGFNGLGTRT